MYHFKTVEMNDVYTLETKICTKCKEEKPLTAENWYRGTQSKGGFRATCKECRNIRQKLYNDKNRDVLLAKKKNKYWKNPDKFNKRTRGYYKDNREVVIRKQKNKAQNLNDYYIKELLKSNGYKLEGVNPELIEVKREILKIQRLIKQKQL